MKTLKLSSNKHSLNLLFASALALSFASCSGSKSDNATDTMGFSCYSASASFELKDSAEDYQADENIIVTDSISLLLPNHLCTGVDVEALRDSILSYAIDSLNVKDAGKAIRAFAKAPHQWSELGYEVSLLEGTKRVDESDGCTLVQGSIVNLSPELLVYCINAYEYMPHSAHGITTMRYINFLQKDGGKILTFSDLFTPEGLEQLPARISEQAEETIDREANVDINSLPDSNNFYISPSGEIVMVYQPYEAAPYSSGVIEVRFYPYEISDLMTPFAQSLFNVGDM